MATDPVHHRPAPKSRQDEQEKTALKRRRIELCKSISKDIAKKCVLYGVMAAYTFLGGFAFVALEQTNEKTTCSESQNLYDSMETRTAKSFWNMSRSYLKADDDEGQLERIQQQVAAFRDNVLAIGYDGLNCSMLGKPNGTLYKWNLASSLLFSVTIFTTVGYGNIAPKTTWGRLVCIAYAMCGIPLMFVCLASIGEILGEVFRFIYFNICCLGFCKRRRQRLNRLRTSPSPIEPARPTDTTTTDAWKNRLIDDNEDEGHDGDEDEDEMSVPITVTLLVIAGYIGLGIIMFASWEGWDAMSAAYYCFITITTIGFGDVVPGFALSESGSELKMIVAALYLLFGMSLMSMGLDLIQYEMKNKVPLESSGDKVENSTEVSPPLPPPVLPAPALPKPAWMDPESRGFADTAHQTKKSEMLGLTAHPKNEMLGSLGLTSSPPDNSGVKKRGPRTQTD